MVLYLMENCTILSAVLLTLMITTLLWFIIACVNTPLWAAHICAKGSKSFFLASMFYPSKVRNRIFVFYAFARLSDDLIDEYTGEQQISNFRFLKRVLDYWYTNDISAKEVCYSIPILPNTFSVETIQKIIFSLESIVKECKIPRWAFELLMVGFKHDTSLHWISDETDLLKYCICVASSIGVICTHLYQNGGVKKEMLIKAASLGIAFQLTNISRDIITDLKQLQRIYVPKSWMNAEQRKQFQQMCAGNDVLIEANRNKLIRNYSVRLIEMAEVYYSDAWTGIKCLPKGVQMAVYSALLIYREIGMKILRENVYPNRSFVSSTDKLKLIIGTKESPKFAEVELSDFKNRASEMLQEVIEKLQSE